MSKVFAIGLAAAVIGFAASQPANAGHRRCWGYGWYSYPSYGYTYSNYGTYSNYATYYAPSATAATNVPPAPSGQVARTDNGVYRSFSDEPGQAAPAPTYQSAPLAPAPAVAPAASSDYGTVGNPYGGSGVTIGGVPSPSSNYGTANNPSGTGGITIGGGTYSGGTTGGTAGHPY